MTAQKKLSISKAALIIFMIVHAIMCYFGCVQVTTKWLNLGELFPPDVEVEYRWLCAPFVTLMALIRLALLWRNKASLHKWSCALSVAVAIVTSAWLTILSLSRPIYGGLTSTTMSLSTIGQIAVILAWVIAVAQIGLFYWTKKAAIFPEYADQAGKNNRKTAIWIAVVILILLILVAFRDPLIDLLRNI